MQLAVSNAEPALFDKLAAAFPHLAFHALAQGLIRVEAGDPVHVGPLVRFLEKKGARQIIYCGGNHERLGKRDNRNILYDH